MNAGHNADATRGDDGAARHDAEYVGGGAGQATVVDAGHRHDGAASHDVGSAGQGDGEGVARLNVGAATHLQVLMGEGVRGGNVARRKSVGELVK